MKISRVMSTQHPDNVRSPFFCETNIISNDDEIKEAFYVYSHLKCREQLWDCEGKEVDNHVVKKLLSRYEPFFSKNRLGQDIFLTLRVPNPSVEKNEAKILLETLESIPRSYDTAKAFYNDDVAPIFEVALPMTTSPKCPIRIAEYYKQFVIGKKNKPLVEGDVKLSEWIGDFKPETIRVIPLLETIESISNSHEIVRELVQNQKINDYQRVWLARSDPALNYGSLAAVLVNKMALSRLQELQEKLSVEILPILGCGSAPFRGNLTPKNVDNIMRGYPSVQTFTVQSAFKFDYPEQEVVAGIEKLNETPRRKPIAVDYEKTMRIALKLKNEYQKNIGLLAPFVNQMCLYVPERRKRKLHTGLFGYSRSVEGITLPRTIKFCAALYSWGLPPELLALDCLSEKDIDYVKDIYPSFEHDLKSSLRLLNKDNLKFFPREITSRIELIRNLTDYEEDYKHKKITSIIVENLIKKEYEVLKENIERAGSVRGFLG